MKSVSCLLYLILFVSAAFGQSARKPAAKSSAAPQASAATSSQHAAVNAETANRPDKQVIESFLHKMFGYDANIKWEIRAIEPAADPALTQVLVILSNPQGQQSTRLYITPGGQYALAGELLPFGADPFAKARTTMQGRLNGPAKGAANAPITIVEFGDLQCPSCKAAQPIIDRLMSDVPNARLVYQQFPLVQIHNWAMKAALYGQCVADQNNDAYWRYLSQVYQNQEQIKAENADERLKQYATEAGADANKLSACINDPATTQKIQGSIDLGNRLDVNATPTLFINGRKIASLGTLPYDMLKSLTEFLATQK